MSIDRNLKLIIKDIDESAKKVGKTADDVTLVAVTKLHSTDEINEAIRYGVTDIGENKVQEIQDKYEKVMPVRWHLIGHLQRNKVKYIIDKVYMIHSLDSEKLAAEIDKRAKQNNVTMNVLIQVNAAEEESKFGVRIDQVDDLINNISQKYTNVRVRGLMCIAPFYDNPEDARACFLEVKGIYDKYVDDSREGVDFKYLSMGMSGDFRVAIEEGSNMVRVGTAIFGARDYR